MQVHHSARPQRVALSPLAVALSTLRWASNSAALGDSTHYMTNSLAAPFVYHEGIT